MIFCSHSYPECLEVLNKAEESNLLSPSNVWIVSESCVSSDETHLTENASAYTNDIFSSTGEPKLPTPAETDNDSKFTDIPINDGNLSGMNRKLPAGLLSVKLKKKQDEVSHMEDSL